MPGRLHLERFGPVHGLPILHYRMEFAFLVRQAVQQLQPDCIAIELPATLEEPFCKGVDRLPMISALRYYPKQQERTGGAVWLLIEPADPLVEAARLAHEQGIPLKLVDADTDSYPLHQDQLPDSYSIQRIGLASYYHAYCKRTELQSPGHEDQIREQAMAFHLQKLAKQYQRILFVCGMCHLERVKQAFEQPQAAPMARSKREQVSLFNLHPDSCREILGEYPFISAVYEHRRSALPDGREDGGATLRKRFNLFELIQGGKQEVAPEQLLDNAILRSARHCGTEGEFPDRQRMILRLFMEASRHYRQETGETVHHW